MSRQATPKPKTRLACFCPITKTTVCRKVTAVLHPRLYRVFYLPLSTANLMDMYKAIGREPRLPAERNRASAQLAVHGRPKHFPRSPSREPSLTALLHLLRLDHRGRQCGKAPACRRGMTWEFGREMIRETTTAFCVTVACTQI
jgi:hypothetical protein